MGKTNGWEIQREKSTSFFHHHDVDIGDQHVGICRLSGADPGASPGQHREWVSPGGWGDRSGTWWLCHGGPGRKSGDPVFRRVQDPGDAWLFGDRSSGFTLRAGAGL
jgi:hypothetical protein